jgi:cytosine/adenosine deaminase-related metal-dependent hydrolase
MIIQNVHIIGQEGSKHIRVIQNKIVAITSDERLLPANKEERSITFHNSIAFPGLINSHDHLEFNLFPQLGSRVYKSYLDWGEDIHRQNKDVIDAISSIPKPLRAEWGMYKNLLNGITTVVQHGEYFKIDDPLVTVFQDCYSLHSVRLEKNWKLKLNNPFAKDQPYVIHTGEGTDENAFAEINELIKWNLFKRKLVAVHGVSMNEQQAKSFEALVWCPASNYFLLNTTAKIDRLKNQTKILFGTDSTVSAGWNLWEQLRLARKTNMLTDEELFNSLTALPAAVWKLNDRGSLAEGKNADIVVARMSDANSLMNSFFQLGPADILLVVRNGEIILFDETLSAQLGLKGFTKLVINDVAKYVKGDLAELVAQINQYAPEAKLPIRLNKQ